jgi:ribosomal RNA assembly protein
MEDTIMIGHNRIPVLIGQEGKTKKYISKKTNTSIEVDSQTGEVTIASQGTFLDIYIAKNIITAIARGFSPDNALSLLKDGYVLDVIPLDEYVRDNKERYIQVKGRVIGRDGKIKSMIERKCNCILAVYGKTVSIIAQEDNVVDVRNIIEKILSGAKHTTAFKMLKKAESNANGFSNTNRRDQVIDDIDFSEDI